MRDILFRGKAIDDGKWVYGSLICAGSFVAILQNEDDVHPTDYPYLDSQLGTIDGKATPIDPSTIGQYIGLTDKNGKKIFEGDIVVNKEGTPYEVAFIEEYARFAFKRKGVVFGWFNPKSAEIIGNIYDNPKLLEEIC